MCGIFCEILNNNEDNQVLDKCRTNLERRGPNSVCEKSVDGIRFFGTVLHHQGLKPTVQPIINDDFVLLFNGDLFMDLNLNGQSDTDHLVFLLDSVKDASNLKEVIETLKGPYSFIYYNRAWKKLYFVRDGMGRNSLLVGFYKGSFFVSSVCCYDLADYIAEVPPIGIFCYNLDNNELSVSPWYETGSHPFYEEQIDTLSRILQRRVVKEDETISLPWLNFLQITNFTLTNTSCDQWDSQNPEVNEVCDRFIELLSKSVTERATLTSSYCKICLNGDIVVCNHCRVGILFSGGLDCSILAILADKVIPKNQSVDLFNVAFEKVKRALPDSKHHKSEVVNKHIDWDVPDRLSAKVTLQELQEVCPDRQWNLVEVNVTRNELEQELTHHLRDLISPSKNILDESLGAALWFASRGKGFINGKPFESTCRVLLLGSGADELFGGYSRHRTAFKRAAPGDNELIKELELDWIRLPHRNLARDDRVISDHSMTPRTPYLQEKVVELVRSLKANQRCNLNLEAGVGDKLFLRLCAHKLGLRRCCFLKKRALQFGSRIADSRQKADCISTYFQK